MIVKSQTALCPLLLVGSLLACQGTEKAAEDTAPASGGTIMATGGAFAGGQPALPAAGSGGVGGSGAIAGAGGTGLVPPVDARAPGAGGANHQDAQVPPDGSSTACEPFVMPDDCTIPEGAVLPGELRCTGLYGNWQARELACGVMQYTPGYELWSDGAEKYRYVSLPPGGAIDVSNPDDFVYPVGTQFWKEFRVGSQGSQQLGETRLMRKTDLGWLYTAYVWSEDASTAVQVNDGVEDLLGTGHTVPTREQCRDCHAGRPDFILGWDFFLLGDGAAGITRDVLAAEGLLTGLTAPDTLSAAIPGDAVERAALGYLHANCGVSCHNSSPEAAGRLSGLWLRLELDQLGSVQATDAVTSGVNQSPSPNVELTGLPEPPGPFYDFRPLDPERSLAVAKMNTRASATTQMPPIGTNHIDDEGVSIITAWVNHMTAERGYPPAAP